MAAARETLQSQLEHLQMKYVGTGHADIGKHEWLVNQHRDSLASYVGHPGVVAYVAAVENQAAGRVRYNMLQKMVRPCPRPAPAQQHTPAQ